MSSAPVGLDPKKFPCEGAGKHYPPSLAVNEAHHIIPIEWQKELYPEITRPHPHYPGTASLCGTCHNNVHYLLLLFRKANGQFTYKQLVPPGFPKKTVAIAIKGWEIFWHERRSVG